MSMHYGATYGYGLCLVDDEIDAFYDAVKAKENLAEDQDAYDFVIEEFGTWVFDEYENTDLMCCAAKEEPEKMLCFYAKKLPDPFKAVYSSPKEMEDEFRAEIGKYLPDGFDYAKHIGWFDAAVYA